MAKANNMLGDGVPEEVIAGLPVTLIDGARIGYGRVVGAHVYARNHADFRREVDGWWYEVHPPVQRVHDGGAGYRRARTRFLAAIRNGWYMR